MSAPQDIKVCITGAGGMLAHACALELAARLIPFHALDRRNLDIADPASVRAVIDPACTHILNCAAWTDVDGAESHKDAAFLANTTGPRVLAQHARANGQQLIHVSTDYVFGGNGADHYRTDDTPCPVNVYGESKAAGEQAIMDALPDHSLIVRTGWLNGISGTNFVRTIRRLAYERETLNVVNDQIGRPSFCTPVARAIVRLLMSDVSGIVHVCGGGEPATWFDLAKAIVEHAQLDCVVNPCTSDQYPRPARRPSSAVLDLSQTKQYLGVIADWRDQLDEFLHELDRAPTRTASD